MAIVSELTIAQSVFEGLFARVLKPTGAFREELRAVGYDMERQETTYALGVWDAALKVAARHVHPGLPPAEALRQLGAQFIDGFFETITGRLVAAALPVLGADGVMKRLPRFWGSGAPGTSVAALQEGPGNWRVEVQHPSPQADFDVGMIRAGLRRTGVDAQVELLERHPQGYAAQVRWGTRAS